MTNWHGIFLAAGLTFGLNVDGIADDWPQWRGPNRDAVSQETGLLKEWPAGGPPLVWKAEGLGGGYSTPSIKNGRIYGMGYRDDYEEVWVLNESDGGEVWRVRIGPAYHDMGYDQGPRATPTPDGDRIYTLGGGGNLVCLDADDGSMIWKREYRQDFDGKLMSGWGFSESPLVDGDRVVCTPGGVKGTVAALNKMTGDLLWRSTGMTDAAAYASLIVAEIGGVRQYIVLTDESVAGIAAEDGSVLWRADRAGRVAVIPTPIYRDNRVWVTSGYNVGCNLFKISPSNGDFDVTEVYSNRDIKNHHGGAILVKDHIYASSGPVIVCMEFLTGKVAWEERSVGKGSLGYADGRLYLRSEDGPIALIKATPDEFVEISRFDQPFRSDQKAWSHPIIVNGKLYLRDQNILLCYDVKQH